MRAVRATAAATKVIVILELLLIVAMVLSLDSREVKKFLGFQACRPVPKLSISINIAWNPNAQFQQFSINQACRSTVCGCLCLGALRLLCYLDLDHSAFEVCAMYTEHMMREAGA